MAHMEPEYVKDQWVEVEGDGITYLPLSEVGQPRTWNQERADIDSPWLLEELARFYGEFVERGPESITSVEIICNMRNTAGESGLPVGVRLSAAGYLDCTDWTIFATEREARAYIVETYGVDPDTGDPLEEVTA